VVVVLVVVVVVVMVVVVAVVIRIMMMIMTKTRLRAGRSGVRFPNGVRNFSFLINALKLWHTQTFIKGDSGIISVVKAVEA